MSKAGKYFGLGLVAVGLAAQSVYLYLLITDSFIFNKSREWETMIIVIALLLSPALAAGGVYCYRRAAGASWWRVAFDAMVACIPILGPAVLLVQMLLLEQGITLPWILRIPETALVAIPVGAVMLQMTMTHGSYLSRIMMGEAAPGAEIVVPEPPLQDDDAFSTLQALAQPVYEPIRKAWGNAKCSGKSPRDPVCPSILEQHLDALKPFDAWVASKKRYGFDRPVDLARHTRGPFTVGINAEIPNYLSFLTLGRLLEARIVKKLSAGDTAGAERDLRTLFALADFLQQNPRLIGEMVGIAIQSRGLRTIIWHWPADSLPNGFDTMLPMQERLLDGYRMSVGWEWLDVRHEFPKGLELTWVAPIWLENFLGFYDQDDTLRVVARSFRYLLDMTETAEWEKVPVSVPECEGSLLQPNPEGRRQICKLDIVKNHLQYVVRTAHLRDKVEATRVVLAARRYWREKNAWPTQEADLVPKYLPVWPMNLRTGKPLAWLDHREGVQMSDSWDEEYPSCKRFGTLFCGFQFAPQLVLKARR